jgi:hypothetical protein
MTNQTPYQKAHNNGRNAQMAFREMNSEILASFATEEVAGAIIADIRLNHQEELVEHHDDFSFVVTRMEKSFLDLYDRGILIPNAPLTSRGAQNLLDMRQRTGIGYATPATPQELARDAQADLEAEVIHDWKHSSSDVVKKKIYANPAYSAAFNRLSETDAIGGTSATYTRIASAPDGSQYGRR